MRTILCFLVSWMACAVLAADLPSYDVLKAGTKTYKMVKVTVIEPSGIRFTHETGAARAKFEELEPEVRSMFKIDPVKARAFEDEKELQRMKTAYAAQEAKQTEKLRAEAKKLVIRIQGTVQQVLSDGVLLTDVSWSDEDRIYRLDGARLICDGSQHSDGERIGGEVYPVGTSSFATVLGVRRTVNLYASNIEDCVDYLKRK